MPAQICQQKYINDSFHSFFHDNTYLNSSAAHQRHIQNKIAHPNLIQLVGRASLSVCQLVKFNIPVSSIAFGHLPHHKTPIDVFACLPIISYASNQTTNHISSC
jgi:hypothetical protein